MDGQIRFGPGSFRLGVAPNGSFRLEIHLHPRDLRLLQAAWGSRKRTIPMDLNGIAQTVTLIPDERYGCRLRLAPMPEEEIAALDQEERSRRTVELDDYFTTLRKDHDEKRQ